MEPEYQENVIGKNLYRSNLVVLISVAIRLQYRLQSIMCRKNFSFSFTFRMYVFFTIWQWTLKLHAELTILCQLVKKIGEISFATTANFPLLLWSLSLNLVWLRPKSGRRLFTLIFWFWFISRCTTCCSSCCLLASLRAQPREHRAPWWWGPLLLPFLCLTPKLV